MEYRYYTFPGIKSEPRLDGASLEESSVTDAEDFLKPDELVNCICDFQEENGLMIQVGRIKYQ